MSNEDGNVPKYTDDDLAQENLDGRFEMIEAVCRHLRDTGRDDIAAPLWEKFRPSGDDERRRDRLRRLIAMLERRDIVTTDPAKAGTCCGIERDEDGFCQYRGGHPIYVQT